MLDELFAFIAKPAVLPAITFVVGGVMGFIATRFTMTASERSLHKQRLYENSNSHKRETEKKYLEFVESLRSYCEKKEPVTLADFQGVATTGELYFNELKMVSSAILDGRVDHISARDSFVPSIVDALQKNIPQYYATLNKIADKVGASYSGEFRRTNYEVLFKVAEKYASDAVLPPVRDAPSAL